MQFSSHANLSLEMTNGRPLCPSAKRPCGASALNRRKLPTTNERSNVRDASILRLSESGHFRRRA